jgi:phosphoserine phosphatase
LNLKKIEKTIPQAAVEEIRKAARKDSKWVFDCDGTLVQGDVGTVAAWTILKAGLASAEQTPSCWKPEIIARMEFHDFENLRYKLAGEVGFQQVFDWETLVLTGLPKDMAEEFVLRGLEIAFQRSYLKEIHPVTDLARDYHRDSFIVSGSPKVSVAQMGHRLGIEESRVIATELEDVDGILTSNLKPPGTVWAEFKALLLKKRGVTPFFVAGDSTGDWDMMSMSTHYVWAVVWLGRPYIGTTLDQAIKAKFEIEFPKEAGLYSFQSEKQKWFLDLRNF